MQYELLFLELHPLCPQVRLSTRQARSSYIHCPSTPQHSPRYSHHAFQTPFITTNRNNNIIIFWCPAPLPLPSKLTIKVLSNFDYNKALLRIFISFIMSPFSTTPFKGCLYDNKTSLSMISWAFQNHIFSPLFPSKFFPLFSPQIHNTEETACLSLDTTGSYTSLHLHTVMPFLGIL